MKLRIARKIIKNILRRERRYKKLTIKRAYIRKYKPLRGKLWITP